jgi:lysophospholipase L1-like esterase
VGETTQRWSRNRWWVGAIAIAAAAAATLAAPTPAEAAEPRPVPTSMASLGDSITRGFNTCGWFFDCTSRSWSTGGGDGVTSHFERLQAIDPAMSSRVNLARSGARISELPSQAQGAVDRGVGYVTVLLGANDACTSSEATMTSVTEFETSVTAAFDILAGASTPPAVLAASIPDIQRLWEVGKDSSSARTAWSAYGICQSMLANPTSTADADVERRARVRQRVIDFNTVIADVCAQHAFCTDDGQAVFEFPFERSQLSTWDYFHPNTSGQNVLAEVTWTAGFDWTAAGSGDDGGNGGGNGGGKGGGKKK